MSPGIEIVTERLRLRQWREDDRPPFATMNADPEVMRYFPKPLTREESDAFVDRIEEHWRERGYGLWAVERADDSAFIGVVGLNTVQPPIPCAPAVEVGWRLAREFWRRGYALEAAGASLRFGFERLRLEEIVAFTFVGNLPSRAVMARLGMSYDPQADFDHPRIPEDSPVRAHVLYRIEAGQESSR